MCVVVSRRCNACNLISFFAVAFWYARSQAGIDFNSFVAMRLQGDRRDALQIASSARYAPSILLALTLNCGTQHSAWHNLNIYSRSLTLLPICTRTMCNIQYSYPKPKMGTMSFISLFACQFPFIFHLICRYVFLAWLFCSCKNQTIFFSLYTSLVCLLRFFLLLWHRC